MLITSLLRYGKSTFENIYSAQFYTATKFSKPAHLQPTWVFFCVLNKTCILILQNFALYVNVIAHEEVLKTAAMRKVKTIELCKPNK